MIEGHAILIAGSLLCAGIVAALLARRLRVPGLVLFLALGIALGRDGLGLIDFSDIGLARSIGTIGLVLILFEGGLAAGWSQIRPVFVPSLVLALVGTVATALIVGFASMLFLGLSVLLGLLLGAIVASTDAAAIFSMLRGSTLDRRVARTLEAESGFNDPIAILLVVGLISLLTQPSYGVADLVALFVRQVFLGAGIGLVVGRLAQAALSRFPFTTSGLYPVATVSAAAIAFGAADTLGGSGFLSVYVCALLLGSAQIPARRTVADFHDGLGWVSQITLFFTLGLLVAPGDLLEIAPTGLALAGVLMLVARPIAVLLSTAFMRFSIGGRVLLGWAGLRGAVPIVLATFPVIAGVGGTQSFFALVFFVVLSSALVQGTTFEPLARALGITSQEPALSRPLIEIAAVRRLGAEVIEYVVDTGDAVVGRLVNELALPREALLSVIVRKDQAILPRGSTVIQDGDRLHILVRERFRSQVEQLCELWRAGPIGAPEPVRTRSVGRASILTVRPLQASDGDPGNPDRIGGVQVARRIRTRHDRAGALVQLSDGRYAVIAEETCAIGGTRDLFRYCRLRIRRSEDPSARAWWQEVAGALSEPIVL
jgi:potassium/hydrogen antiporter